MSNTTDQWEDPKPEPFKHGWDINIREDCVAWVEGTTLTIGMDGGGFEFDLNGAPFMMCYQPRTGGCGEGRLSPMANRLGTTMTWPYDLDGYGPFDIPDSKFFLEPFRITANPIKTLDASVNRETYDRSILERAGRECVNRDIWRYVQDMLDAGAERVWRVWRRRVLVLPADTQDELGVVVVCGVAMLGVK